MQVFGISSLGFLFPTATRAPSFPPGAMTGGKPEPPVLRDSLLGSFYQERAPLESRRKEMSHVLGESMSLAPGTGIGQPGALLLASRHRWPPEQPRATV